MKQCSRLAAFVVASFLLPAVAFADAAGDLAEGRAALANGEPETALPLLSSAAEALPESVEAQLALGECHLQLGRLDDALARYRAVVGLSPEHERATRMVAALTARNQSFEEQLAAARLFLEFESYDEAASTVGLALRRTLTPAQRAEANLLLAEARLWGGRTEDALGASIEAIRDGLDDGPARVVAAMSLVLLKDRRVDRATEMLAKAGELEGVWKSRADVTAALVDLANGTRHAEASRTLATSLGDVPNGPRRANVRNVAFTEAMQEVTRRRRHGDLDGALAIVWPMISDAEEIPVAEDVLKPLSVDSGWVIDDAEPSASRTAVVAVLSDLGRAEFVRDGSRASLLGHWIAARLAGDDAELVNDLAGRLSSLGRPSRSRERGTVLSPADAIQRELILAAAVTLPSNSLVALMQGHIDRYAQADELETGIAQFATIADDGSVTLAGSLANLLPGDAERTVLTLIARNCETVGASAFRKATNAVVVGDGARLGRHDLAALDLAGRLQARYSGDTAGEDIAIGVFERLATAEAWDDAAKAIEAFYARQPDVDADWGLARLKARRVAHDEDRLLAARRTLGVELSDPVKAVLADAIGILEDGSERDRAAGIALVGGLVTRYANLGRGDLAAAVVATIADPENGAKSLADWTLWQRAGLLEAEASRTLAADARASLDRSKLAVDANHVAELAVLVEIVTKHPESPFAAQAVDRVVRLSEHYRALRAWAAARQIPEEFAKAIPKLAAIERFRYQIVSIGIAEAEAVFAERTRVGDAPEALLAEDVAAIDALVAFLKEHPVGPPARDAEDQLFAVARRYGEAGGWVATRDVVDRIGKAIPDFRSPAHVKLLRAATFLGELDGERGLALLTPNTSNDDPDGQPNEGQPGGGKPGEGKPGDGPGRPGTPRPGFDLGDGTTEPTAIALAMIRESQARQFRQLAMLENARGPNGDAGRGGREEQGVVLPSGTVLSAAEMKRQDDASDAAYAILVALAKDDSVRNVGIATAARSQILWLVGYFEDNLRADRAIVLVQRFLKDVPDDPERVALAYRIVVDRLSYAARLNTPVGFELVDERHQQFERARGEIDAFIKAYADETDWVNTARLLVVESYLQEAALVGGVAPVRASGLRVQAADALLALQTSVPDHPESATFASRLWRIAESLSATGNDTAAVGVLRHITVRFPTNDLAGKSIIRTAQLHARNLANPIRAVETYQEYLSRTDGDPSVPTEIFNIAAQLAERQRYLEALHVYGVFVDGFPTDERAATALHAIGRIHQQNGAWAEAITSYERLFEEYPEAPIVPRTRLDVAECRINLGEWDEARDLYADFAERYPQDGQVATARTRIDVLRKLSQFQDLLADDTIDRNKDDAQFQIGRTVLAELANPVKAVAEFRKVVEDFPTSDLADDAQLEIGKALLSLNRLDDARRELLRIPERHANSPLADDALHLIGQSYESQAVALANVTLEKAREDSYVLEQKYAYSRYRMQNDVEMARDAAERGAIKKEGDATKLALNEASQAWLRGSSHVDNLYCNVTQAELQAETETAMQIANRQDRINDAYRSAVEIYARASSDYPLGDMTDRSLIRVADILESKLKDRAAAMATYQNIVKLFPGTPVAEDAAWKVAVFHVEESQYARAVEGFQTFIRNYPASDRVADAQFAMAEVLEQMGKWNDAMDAYEVFRQKFARHPKVQLASRQITWIKTYRK